MVYVKVHRKEGEVLVAACDRKVLGKAVSEGDVCLNILPGFYQGDKINVEDLGKELDEATVANLAGKEVVEYAILQGYIDRENVLEVAGIPHAQFVLV